MQYSAVQVHAALQASGLILFSQGPSGGLCIAAVNAESLDALACMACMVSYVCPLLPCLALTLIPAVFGEIITDYCCLKEISPMPCHAIA